MANFPVADSFNRKLERDVSNGDMPNAFVASFTYDLPIGKGKRFNPGGVAGAVFNNLEFAAAGFGLITSAGDPRVVQFGLKLNF